MNRRRILSPRPFYILLFSLIFLSNFTYGNMNKRIIGGSDAPAEKFPWAVSIRGEIPDRLGVTNVCGATLINNQWLLTAAHCFWSKGGDKVSDYRDAKYWHIIAGQVFVDANRYLQGHQQTPIGKPPSKSVEPPLKYGGPPSKFGKETKEFDDLLNQFEKDFQDMLKKFETDDKKRRKRTSPPKAPIQAPKEDHFHVVDIILHPKYKPDDIEWDIALMRLNKPIPEMIGVKSIPLPPTKEKNWASLPQDKEECILVGWGCTKGGGSAVSRAKFTKLEIVGFDKCNKAYNGQAGLNKEHEFCAGFINKDIGVCPGDSGGGLICSLNSKYYVAGVTSATHRARPGSYPGLFTKVSYFKEWIDKTISAD